MMSTNQVGDLYSTSGKKTPRRMGFGYTVGVTLEDNVAGYSRGKGAFGWGGAFGTVSWTDPENELVAVMMLQQPHKGVGGDFENAIKQAIID
jgi:CubicO group peptidase (beta-lactamase class C family)